jgi:hypothetical protein
VISRDPNLKSGEPGEQNWARMQQDLLHLSANASSVIATGSSHAVNIERPDVVIQSLRKMVEDIRRGTGSQSGTTSQIPGDTR